ncbi:MAG: sulfatase-like hydrolase/transferase [Thermoanaerobaculia bacterium]
MTASTGGAKEQSAGRARVAGLGELRVFLWIGFAWAGACFLIVAVRLSPPPRASAWLVLVLVALFLALAHGTLWTLLSWLLTRALPRSARQLTLRAILALAAGTFYTAIAMSLVKFSYTRAPMRFEDLWFVFGNFRQLVSEGSWGERLLIFAGLALPIVFALVIFGALRRADRSSRPLPLRTLLLLAALAIAGLGLTGWRYPYAGVVTGSLIPETSWVARNFFSSPARGESGKPSSAFASSAAQNARIGSYVAPAQFRRENVVVILLESVPWSRLFGPEARVDATPRLHALAAESTVFARAYATATHSDYAQTSILASLHPRKFDHHDYFRDLAYPRTLLWDLLQPLGYRTALFSCQNESWGNMKAFLQTPGLELFRHSPDWPDAPRRGEGAESKVFEATPVAIFREWLGTTGDRPFLASLNFQATHYPYVIPPGTAPRYEPSTIDFSTTFLSYPADRIPVMENRFYNALASVDAAVGDVVDALIASGKWDRTVLLVVSDHGEAFYEHGMPTHGTMLLEEQVRTAALLRLPGEPARVVTQPVSVLDLVPSVVQFLGLPAHGNFQGRSDVLAPGYSAQQRAFLMTIQGITQEDGVLLDDWKLLRNYDRREEALFDLASDPQEQVNLAGTRPEKRTELEKELDRLLGLQLNYYREQDWQLGWYPPKLP